MIQHLPAGRTDGVRQTDELPFIANMAFEVRSEFHGHVQRHLRHGLGLGQVFLE